MLSKKPAHNFVSHGKCEINAMLNECMPEATCFAETQNN